MTGSAMPERTASASPAAARARAGLQSDSESRPYLRPSLRLSGIVEESIVDGPGLRFVLFTQGCPHGCKGCHNPETHSLEGGFIRDVDELLAVYDENPLLAGVTFSGGEPFLQAAALCAVAERVRARGGDVVTYTGYTYESLLARAERGDASEIARLLELTDLLIDGPYLEALRDLDLPFRGSSNQRLLDEGAAASAGARRKACNRCGLNRVDSGASRLWFFGAVLFRRATKDCCGIA